MRPQQITVGETYEVSVPRHLPPERYLNFDIQWFARMSLMKGAKLRLSVLSVDPATGMVEGLHIEHRAVMTNVRLPEASVRELGLPARDSGYWMRGAVTDHQENTVLVPETVAFTVLARWVRACTDPVAPQEARLGTANVR